MVTVIRTRQPRLVRLGLTGLTALGLLTLAAFVAAFTVVVSVLVFNTNVFSATGALIALAMALPLAAFGAALVHRRLWGGAGIPA